MRLFSSFLLCTALVCSAFASTAFAKGNATMVRLETNKGDIVLGLYPEKAPLSCENFLQYVRDGFYDGTIFHRVIENFMIQGGGMTASMMQKETRAPIAIESANGLANKEYTLAMARTGDPNSATSQFFINVKDNDFLNYTAPTPKGWGYAVFGRVVSGKEVVEAIRGVETGDYGFYNDVPKEPIIIKKAVIIDDQE